MSDDIKDGERPPKTRILNGVNFVRRSNLGPITIHSIGSSENTKYFDSRISDEEGQAVIDKYVESLKEGIQKATREQDQK